MMKCSMSNESDIDVHLVFSRMLDVLGLKMHICDASPLYASPLYGRGNWLMSNFMSGVAKPLIRQFMNNNGKVLLWKNNCHAKYKLHSVEYEIGYGSWTIFRDDDYVMFQLFTEYIEHWSFESAYLTNHGVFRLYEVPVCKDIHFNPFFGCKSFEEVLIKCDLLGYQ